MLADQEWLARSPSLAAWVALAILLALIACERVVLDRRAATTSAPGVVALAGRLWRVSLIVAFVPAAVAVISAVDVLAFMWWLLAGAAFGVVLVVTAGAVVALLAHDREIVSVPPHRRATTWFALSIQLVSVLCIPLLFVAWHDAAGWDQRTRLACSICVGYVLSVLAAALVHRSSRDGSSAARPPAHA